MHPIIWHSYHSQSWRGRLLSLRDCNCSMEPFGPFGFFELFGPLGLIEPFELFELFGPFGPFGPFGLFELFGPLGLFEPFELFELFGPFGPFGPFEPYSKTVLINKSTSRSTGLIGKWRECPPWWRGIARVLLPSQSGKENKSYWEVGTEPSKMNS